MSPASLRHRRRGFNRGGASDRAFAALARAFRVENLPMGRFKAIKGIEHLKGIRLIDQQPIGRRHVKVCRTLSCALNGAERVTDVLARKLGIRPGI